MEKGVNITYDTLFELLIREKTRAELQQLEPDFFTSVDEFLKDKKASLSKEKLDVFSDDEREKTEKQIKNVQRILKEIYERREKKILELAMIKSRNSSAAIDTTPMLASEKRMFDELTKMMGSYRESVLIRAVNGTPQTPKTDEKETKVEQKEPETKIAATAEATDTAKQAAEKTVRFTHEVPKFLGRELEVYGPFNAEDTAKLPTEIADILIGKGRAEEIAE